MYRLLLLFFIFIQSSANLVYIEQRVGKKFSPYRPFGQTPVGADPRLARLCRRQHDGELQQAPRPYGQGQEHQQRLGNDLVVFERVEELDDVGGGTCAKNTLIRHFGMLSKHSLMFTDVNEQQLAELVSGEVSFGQKPSADDQRQHQELFYQRHPSFGAHWYIGQLHFSLENPRGCKISLTN